MSDDKVIVGSIVHYVIEGGECYAAIVTRLYPQQESEPMDLGSIYVTTFSYGDGVDTALAYECQEKPIPGTWHWPQGCPRG